MFTEVIVIHFHRTSGTHVYVGFYNRGTKKTSGEEAAVKIVPKAAVKAHEERLNEGDMLVQFNLKLDNIAVFNVRLYIPY